MNKLISVLFLGALAYCSWIIYVQDNKILALSADNEKLLQAIQHKDMTIQALSDFSELKEELRKEHQNQEQIRKQITQEILQSVQEVIQNDPEAKSWGDTTVPDAWIRVLDSAQSRHSSTNRSDSSR